MADTTEDVRQSLSHGVRMAHDLETGRAYLDSAGSGSVCPTSATSHGAAFNGDSIDYDMMLSIVLWQQSISP